ncbi:MAG: TonB-dependent receptor plug domain-containing protein [Bacteroidales bacterium]|jgi:hypothetical protein|nr:TonB-dependent receptor plug domain-containing protein [Bacteroidales bacterium]NLH24005.1 TonB-dependent receptor plug domain-containing protein [Bacteroidales bacterium]HPJ82217.1 TonB-dependent receptor plug domain-containing protein [Bacteroidales bacterium]
MKKIILAVLFSCLLLPLTAQEQVNDQQKDGTRTFSVKIVDKKGKPLSNLVVSTVREKTTFLTDKKGIVNLEGIADSDSLVVFLPNIGETHIPCAGLDSVQISVRSKTKYHIQDRKELVNLKTNPSNTIANVPEMLKTRPARDLAELLSGQIPGLRITMGSTGLTANIRGINTITGNTEPLIVIDGMTYESFSEVNGFLDVHSIQSIQVQKDGGMYGMRGANGVIIITTIGASSNPLSY